VKISLRFSSTISHPPISLPFSTNFHFYHDSFSVFFRISSQFVMTFVSSLFSLKYKYSSIFVFLYDSMIYSFVFFSLSSLSFNPSPFLSFSFVRFRLDEH
jgi:hypothetical protein